jgi:hypothetical protein
VRAPADDRVWPLPPSLQSGRQVRLKLDSLAGALRGLALAAEGATRNRTASPASSSIAAAAQAGLDPTARKYPLPASATTGERKTLRESLASLNPAAASLSPIVSTSSAPASVPDLATNSCATCTSCACRNRPLENVAGDPNPLPTSLNRHDPSWLTAARQDHRSMEGGLLDLEDAHLPLLLRLAKRVTIAAAGSLPHAAS